jgi:hypothetical protein
MGRKLAIYSVVLALVLSIIACNLPGLGGGDETNSTYLTVTALFSTINAPTPTQAPPTSTPEPQETATPEQSDTPLPPTETETPATTDTATPTNTAVPLPSRSAGFFYARYFSSPPKIDGNWDEWNSTTYSANLVVYGASNWSGSADLSSAFKAGWDTNYLYIAAKVNDDHYVQNGTSQWIYKGDSVEILVDSDLFADFYTQSLNYDDYQLGISPGNPSVGKHKEAELWFPSNVGGTKNQVKIGATGSDGGYRVEFAVPWSLLDVTPFYGAGYGFVFRVSDNDTADTQEQQSMVSSTAGQHLTDPTTWSELVLVR